MNDFFNYGKSNVTVYGEDKKIKTRFKIKLYKSFTTYKAPLKFYNVF